MGHHRADGLLEHLRGDEKGLFKKYGIKLHSGEGRKLGRHPRFVEQCDFRPPHAAGHAHRQHHGTRRRAEETMIVPWLIIAMGQAITLKKELAARWLPIPSAEAFVDAAKAATPMTLP